MNLVGLCYFAINWKCMRSANAHVSSTHTMHQDICYQPPPQPTTLSISMCWIVWEPKACEMAMWDTQNPPSRASYRRHNDIRNELELSPHTVSGTHRIHTANDTNYTHTLKLYAQNALEFSCAVQRKTSTATLRDTHSPSWTLYPPTAHYPGRRNQTNADSLDKPFSHPQQHFTRRLNFRASLVVAARLTHKICVSSHSGRSSVPSFHIPPKHMPTTNWTFLPYPNTRVHIFVLYFCV